MPAAELYYRWQWSLQVPPAALWPLLSDTRRFNRDAHLPPLDPALPAPDPAGHRRLAMRVYGVRIAWTEAPFEWSQPYRFATSRVYDAGPVSRMRMLAELLPAADGGTEFVYHVWATPRHLLGRWLVPVQIGRVTRREFGAVVRRYEALALAGQRASAGELRVQLAPGAEGRLAAMREALATEGCGPALVDRLVEVVCHGADLDLLRLRPYALADQWGVPRRTVLELCLRATRAGLLEFRWDILCPLCRGASVSALSLADILDHAHCDSCHFDYTVGLDRAVELTFRPTALVRPVPAIDYCVGGPQTTPHIVAQQLLTPGERRTVAIELAPGHYRLRLSAAEQARLVVTPDGPAVAEVSLPTATVTEQRVNVSAQLALANTSAGPVAVVVESLAWQEFATTAAEVTALQVFRDLFSREALRPGQPITVGHQTVLFTDLRGSTRLYREIGDAPAFGRVLEHFDLLHDAIAAEEGAIVKTIGDAVMAVFRQPVAAVRAMLAAQHALAALELDPPLVLKAGIHHGPCIAVTLNERLDYFGSTVNLASRLESLSHGDDVVVSDAVQRDPEVAALLSGPAALRAESFEAELKGFDVDRFRLWRLSTPSP